LTEAAPDTYSLKQTGTTLLQSLYVVGMEWGKGLENFVTTSPPEPLEGREGVEKDRRILGDDARSRQRFTAPTDVQMTARVVFHMPWAPYHRFFGQGKPVRPLCQQKKRTKMSLPQDNNLSRSWFCPVSTDPQWDGPRVLAPFCRRTYPAMGISARSAAWRGVLSMQVSEKRRIHDLILAGTLRWCQNC
jgi:hypothetical protein